MIAVIDYGMGNLRSVEKGFEKVGVEVKIVTDPREVEHADGVVLPGVGAFADAMDNLKKTGMDMAVKKVIAENRPFLGICLGLQLLFETSEEWGRSEGLGIFPGTVKRFPAGLKIPHMGWNQVALKGDYPLFHGISDNTSFYFVHSFYVCPAQDGIKSGVTNYGIDFTSAVCYKNTSAVQFHPEKSSIFGLQILRNFGKVVYNGNISCC